MLCALSRTQILLLALTYWFAVQYICSCCPALAYNIEQIDAYHALGKMIQNQLAIILCLPVLIHRVHVRWMNCKVAVSSDIRSHRQSRVSHVSAADVEN